MSDYTPATEVIRGRIHGRDGFGFWDLEDFNTWLAAHDAEVRADAVAEEPEWEYGVTHDELPGTVFDHLPGDRPATHRRRKTGPWLPVKQEGETE